MVSVIIFFSLASGAGNFFRAVHAFFLYPFTLHDFFTVKALQGIFFSQISPPPLKNQMVHPLVNVHFNLVLAKKEHFTDQRTLLFESKIALTLVHSSNPRSGIFP